MEHSIHVAGRHFIKVVRLTPSWNVIQTVRDMAGDQEDNGDNRDENTGVEFDVGDTTGKALTLVTQVGFLSITFGMFLT
jgi:hypothetical protein